MSVTRGVLSLLLPLSLSLPVAAAAQDPKPVRVPPAQRQQPAGPASVRARIVDAARVHITWDSVPGATTYHVGRLAAPNGWQRLASVPATVLQVADTGRNLSVAHTYRVVAVVGDLASKPTVSEPVQGEVPAGGAGTANSAVPGCESGPGGLTRCWMTKVWAGAGPGGESMMVSCPAGTYLLSGGYNGRMKGYEVTVSTPSFDSGKSSWYINISRNLAVTVPATERQELSVIALCRREQ